MPESIQHVRLVKDLCEYISKEYLNGDRGSILRDSSGVSSHDRCYEIDGYIPDVIGKTFTGTIKNIIGEAKTVHDIENRHTLLQLEAYLAYCSHEAHSAVLVVAVPWAYHQLIRLTLCNIAKRKNLDPTKFIVPSIFRA